VLVLRLRLRLRLHFNHARFSSGLIDDMHARLLIHRISQAAILAKAAFTQTEVKSAIPTAAYVQHLLRSPLYFVLKAVGPSMAPTINDGIAERAVGHVSPLLDPLLASASSFCCLAHLSSGCPLSIPFCARRGQGGRHRRSFVPPVACRRLCRIFICANETKCKCRLRFGYSSCSCCFQRRACRLR
jgi:hypothetical protein